MKRNLLFLLAIGLALTTNAQTTAKKIYVLPNGKRFSDHQTVDSVFKAWGGKVSMTKKTYGTDSVVMHIFPETADERTKEVAADKIKLHLLLNAAAPNFSLNDINHKKHSLNELKGKIVVLNFWFTACQPCIAEMPDLNELKKMYDPQKVVFLSITFNDAKTVKEFLLKQKFDYEPLVDGGQVAKDYGVSSFPTHLVIDATGKITFIKSGGAQIKTLLANAINAAMI